MNGERWIQRVRGFGVAALAEELGLAELGRGALAPCPACGAETRGSTERRGPVGLRRDGAGWTCFRCRASGDAVALVAARVLGRPKPEGADDWRAVRAWCAERGLCDAGSAGAPPAKLRPLPAPRPPAPPVRPPRDELRLLWGRALPVTADADVSAFLLRRSIDPELVAALDLRIGLARALRLDAALPAWARFNGRPWPESGHRLLVPLFDAGAELVSVQARLILADAPGVSKSGNPAGTELRGAVMADERGLRLLRGEAPGVALVVIAEGVPDFLTWATEPDDPTRAVLGIVEGAWTPELAGRIPRGVRVTVATHLDPAGDRYFEQIKATLAGRDVRRWKQPKAKGAV